jgi:hypothetical protein
MKISEALKILKAAKKEHGDIEIMIDQHSVGEALHDEFNYDPCFDLKIQRIWMIDPDTYKRTSRSRTPVVALTMEM